MKILIISKSGDGFGIAQKMQDEGHEVRLKKMASILFLRILSSKFLLGGLLLRPGLILLLLIWWVSASSTQP